jgi:hypothetical protein
MIALKKFILTLSVVTVLIILTGCKNSVQEPTEPVNNVVYGGEPYDKAIGNGNYILHNFVGENTTFPKETVVDATKYYLGKADIYVKGLVNDLDESLKDRPAAEKYFTDYVTAIKNINTFYRSNPLDCLSRFGTIIDEQAQPYFVDIINNLDSIEQCRAFSCCYRVLANES